MLGNGPSLRGFDFGRLARFDVFGMNAAYRYWYEIGWFPQYYSCLDLVVGESHRDAIAELIKDSDRLGIRGFLLRRSLIEQLGEEGESPKVFNFDLLRPGFGNWFPGPVTTGSHTCAWASLLGYRDIYLLGIDCNYVEVVPNAKREEGSVLEIVADAPSPNYFFDGYQQKGDRFNIPNPRKDLHLESWRNVGPSLAARVLNANPSSRVDAFPFVHFDDVERGGSIPVFTAAQAAGDGTLGSPSGYVSVPSLPPEAAKDTATAERQSEGGWNRQGSVLAYTGDWLDEAATEITALAQALKLLPEVEGVHYVGFPWSRLFDLLRTEQPERQCLLKALSSAREHLRDATQIITFCQHPDLPRYQDVLAEAGVTHVFWPYASKQQEFLAGSKISISPFQLAPAQSAGVPPGTEGRKYLFSFIEPGHDAPNPMERGAILAHLSQDQRGLVISRKQWDFARITHSTGEVEADASRELSNPPASIEAWRILHDCVFTLCPAGASGNSVRLWEAIAGGAIPVVLTETWHLPGSSALWEEAAIFSPGGREDILSLPDRLAVLGRDEALLKRKRHALRQLWMLYGPDCFIYDIHKLFLSLAQSHDGCGSTRSALSYSRLLALAAAINAKEEAQQAELDIILLGCSSRVLADPSGFLCRYNENAALRLAYKEAMNSCSRQLTEAMLRNLAARGIALG